MDLKVNEVKNTTPVESQTTHKASDGQFKFMLVSNIEEKDLQNMLSDFFALGIDVLHQTTKLIL